jgi:hypothetical protein
VYSVYQSYNYIDPSDYQYIMGTVQLFLMKYRHVARQSVVHPMNTLTNLTFVLV